MFVVTDNAKEELTSFFEDKEKSPIRIYLAAGGCSGPRLALALDAARDTDQVFDEQGFNFCVDSELFKMTEGITIDSGYMGFIVEPKTPLAASDCGGGCSGCGGGCSS